MLIQDKKIGIIDLGSNSVRLVIFEIKQSGGFKLIDDISETVRLSEGMIDGKYINDVAMRRAIKAIKLFRLLCSSYGISTKNIIAVATAAVRKAENRAQFLKLVQGVTGLSFRLLSGQEEAFYVYNAVINTIDIDEGLIVDIGGGSTEIIRFKNKSIVNSASIPIGAVVATEEHLDKDVIPPYKLAMFEQYLHGILSELGWISEGHTEVVIGLGGTIRSLGKMHRKVTEYPLDISHNYSINTQDFQRIFLNLVSLDLDGRKKIEGISPKRADIVAGGLAILNSILSLSLAARIVISGHGLREGLLLEYLSENASYASSSKKPDSSDVLNFSLDNFMDLYAVRREHAEHICNISLSMFDQLKSVHNLGHEERRILRIAAMLHDIGVSISYYDHHKHSFYIILNSRLNGLTHREIVLVAAVAASHRKDKFKEGWDKQYKQILLPDDNKMYRKLSMFLKIAECLDRSETGVIRSLECSIDKNIVRIKTFRDDDAELELNLANENSESFKKLFKKTLIIT